MIDVNKQVKSISYNGTALSLVGPNLQAKELDVTQNGTYRVTPDDNHDGLSAVNVNVSIENGGAGGNIGLLLNDYDTVHETATNLTAGNGISLPIRNGAGASGRYAWYISADAIPNDRVINKLVKTAATSTSRYYFGYYYPGTSSTPTLDDMKASSYYGHVGLYKFSSVSIGSNGSVDVGNLVVFNKDGLILANDTWANIVTALNAGTIDISNGIYFCSTKVPNATATSGITRTLSFS